MKLIPISKAYRAGYEGIRWDVDDWGVVKAVPEVRVTMRDGSPVVLPENWGKIPGMPASRYQGC
jgi:hypothetical protein